MRRLIAISCAGVLLASTGCYIKKERVVDGARTDTRVEKRTSVETVPGDTQIRTRTTVEKDY